ncbi:MAG: ShlB/FhaC/HecB family hemolysin secretion/activation protein, partial [Proteobacteria bacterium]|nr:ShlB/FhaC/HecB family hemolysin secretion/activation protein [Pseudomonadota bacterium]
MGRIRSCGFPCGAVRPSVGDVDGRRRLRSVLAALSGAPFVLLAAGLWAGAVAQQAPSAVTPGQIEDRFDDRTRLRGPAEPEIERPAAPALPPPVEEKAFLLTGIEIVGSTVYAPSRFVAFYEGLLARQVTLADIEAVARKITDLYERDGYVLSQAAVPEQDVSLGVVSIRIVEGFIGEVLIEGQVEGSESLLRAYANKITADRPTRLSILERYVLLIEDLPGVSVRPLLEPVDRNTGAYKLILDLSHDSVQGFVRVDNRGSRSVGPIQLWAGATFNSVFGLYETSRVRFVTTPQTEELLFFDFAHTEPVGTEGTTVTFAGSYSESEPGGTRKPDDVNSTGQRLEVRGAHPVIRSRALDVYLTGRITFRNSERDEMNVKDFDDRLTVIRLGTIISFDDAAEGRNRVSAEISQGLDILAASVPESTTSRPGASAEFTKVTLAYSRYQKVWNNVAVLLLATGQKSSGTVLASEEIGLGGERFGRAYDPSEITGKDGAAGRIELQYDGSLADSLLRKYQFYGYYDIGAVWADVPAGRQSLASAGFGVRGQFQPGLFGYVELAQPFPRPVSPQ